jgi:hypothetical protein
MMAVLSLWNAGLKSRMYFRHSHVQKPAKIRRTTLMLQVVDTRKNAALNMAKQKTRPNRVDLTEPVKIDTETRNIWKIVRSAMALDPFPYR